MTKQTISRIAQFRVGRRRSTALAFLFVFALGCGQKPQPAAAPPKAPADAPTDQSLTTEQYVELGLPAPDRPWTGEEMTQAAEVLSRIAAGGAERLPRYQSERSGEVFARLTSPDNLEVVTRDSLPATVRIQVSIGLMQGTPKILEVYSSANAQNLVGSTEVVELAGATLRTAASVLNLALPFMAAIPPDDPTYERRQRGIEGAKQGLAITILDSLGLLSHPDTLGHEERTRLIGYMQETFPKLLPLASLETQTEIVKRLGQFQQNAELADFRDSLKELQTTAQQAIAAGEAQPAGSSTDSPPAEKP